jgi:FixJ family two-component response regulator
MSLAHVFGQDLYQCVSTCAPIVFVVDNDISVRESLDLLIRAEEWQAETFASPQEFLARPRPLVPSCLVLDVSLPGLNALDLQKRIAVQRPEVPIIFISGRGDIRTTVEAMKAGAVDFLVKPFRDDVLLRSASEPMIAKPISIKGTGGKSGGRAWKAVELIAGDLLCVTKL